MFTNVLVPKHTSICLWKPIAGIDVDPVSHINTSFGPILIPFTTVDVPVEIKKKKLLEIYSCSTVDLKMLKNLTHLKNFEQVVNLIFIYSLEFKFYSNIH